MAQQLWNCSVNVFFCDEGQAERLPLIAQPTGKVARRLEQYWKIIP